MIPLAGIVQSHPTRLHGLGLAARSPETAILRWFMLVARGIEGLVR